MLNQYSSLMRDVIKEKVETITTKIKKPKSKDNPNDSGRNTENELTEEQEMALKMDMQFKRDSLVQELLEKSIDEELSRMKRGDGSTAMRQSRDIDFSAFYPGR